MKIKMLLGILVLAMLVFSSCAGMLGETGTRKEISDSKRFRLVVDWDSKTIYYKPGLYKSGFQRWNYVSKNPELKPSQALIEFENAFLDSALTAFKNKGYALIETQDVPSEKTSIYVEIRLSFKRGVPPLIASAAATHWFVYLNGEYAFEIYNWQFGSIIGVGGETSSAQDLSGKSIKDFLKKIEKISAARSQ